MATVTSGAVEHAPDGGRSIGLRLPGLAWAPVLAALALHAAVWGAAAPLGRLPSLGALLAAAGASWAAWAWVSLWRAGTPSRPGAVPRVLVDEGPYRFGRNPMVLGLAAMITGAGIALGAPLLAGAAVAYVVIVDRVHLPFEEAQLRRRFGGWYSDYAADVRRWL